MDDDTLTRAPEPFFTTKSVGKGTGLGLSMVYGLAAQSGGLARIFSRTGEGTTVELWLPLARAEAPTAPAPGRYDPIETVPSCRILLVDDDAAVMSVTAAMIEQLGHRVVAVPSAARALDLVRDGAKVDLVITDHAMLGMSGAELAAQLRALRPNLPIVLATGYFDPPSGQLRGLPRLDKPFRMDKLQRMIPELLRHRPGGDGAGISAPLSAAAGARMSG